MTEVRRMDRKWILMKLVSIIAIFMSLFHIYFATFGFITAMKLRSFHLMCAMVLIFLTFPFSKTKSNKVHIPSVIDVICIILAIIVGFYIIFEEHNIGIRLGRPTFWDLLFGSITVILTLEITRRTIGLPLVITGSVLLLYGFFGNYLPGYFSHRGYSFERIMTQLYCLTEGIYGMPLGVIASFVLLFILFGAFLEKSGGGKFFIDMAYSLTGKMRGGPAKTAVIASALMGSISGSAVANVATTGTFTIPMMKKIGYRPTVAGAIEAAASSGGQIMPPIMGATAFILCQFIGIPYVEVIKRAAIPAILFYIGVYAFVHFEACKYHIGGSTGSSGEELPDFKKTLINGGHFILGFVVLLYILLKKYSPAYAAIGGFTSVFIASMIRRSTRMSLKDILEALELGARNCLAISAACACAGLLIGVILLTGVGLAFSSAVLSITMGKLILAILLTMSAGIALSMTLAIAADYIILAILCAPALVELGLDLLTAHFIILWSACYSNVTPPLALGAYTASAIAKSPPMRTAFYGMRIAKGFFIMPLIFAYLPMLSGSPKDVSIVAIMVAFALICFEAALAGYFIRNVTLLERILLFSITILCIWPNSVCHLIGIILLVYVILKQTYQLKV